MSKASLDFFTNSAILCSNMRQKPEQFIIGGSIIDGYRVHSHEKGHEGQIHHLVLTDASGKQTPIVIKAFNGNLVYKAASGPEGVDPEKKQEWKRELCERAIRNHQIMKEAGLPVVDTVKGVFSAAVRDGLATTRIAQACHIAPPFLAMDDASLQGKRIIEIDRRILIGQDAHGLKTLAFNNPDVIQGMATDLGRLHASGFFSARIPYANNRSLNWQDEGAWALHPAYTFWHFLEQKDGRIERMILDLTNFEHESYTKVNPKTLVAIRDRERDMILNSIIGWLTPMDQRNSAAIWEMYDQAAKKAA